MKQALRNSYVLMTGTEDDARLSISDDLFGPSTKLFLSKFIKPNMHVLEVGCGIGQMACWIAEQVSPQGKVIGLDLSQDSLDISIKRANSKGLSNIDFIRSNVDKLPSDIGLFDIVFCRFLLIHLRDPLLALSNMSSKLKPGGILCCEEPSTGTHYCTPPFEPFQKADALTQALGRTNGVNYALGDSIKLLLDTLRGPNEEDLQIEFSQIEITNLQHRSIYALSFDQISSKIIDAQLATKHEVAEISSSLWKLANEGKDGNPLKHRIFSFKRAQASLLFKASIPEIKEHIRIHSNTIGSPQ